MTLPVGRRKPDHAEGDRLSDVFDSIAGPRRYLGTVTAIGPTTFEVTWDDHGGRAVYTHGADPATLRPVRPTDEPRPAQAATAGELAQILAEHPEWPVAVRSVLDSRRRVLAGAR